MYQFEQKFNPEFNTDLLFDLKCHKKVTKCLITYIPHKCQNHFRRLNLTIYSTYKHNMIFISNMYDTLLSPLVYSRCSRLSHVYPTYLCTYVHVQATYLHPYMLYFIPILFLKCFPLSLLFLFKNKNTHNPLNPPWKQTCFRTTIAKESIQQSLTFV